MNALYVCRDLQEARDFENRMRRRIRGTFGVERIRRESFENIDFDNRQCEKCQYLLFLSALKYEPDKSSPEDMPDIRIKPGSMFCLQHADVAKAHGKHFVLIYRYSIDDITSIITQLNSHMGKYRVVFQKCLENGQKWPKWPKMNKMTKIDPFRPKIT